MDRDTSFLDTNQKNFRQHDFYNGYNYLRIKI